jgi:flagellar biogenesis protein FliO
VVNARLAAFSALFRGVCGIALLRSPSKVINALLGMGAAILAVAVNPSASPRHQGRELEMGFFESIFGTELGLPARAVVALVLVLALIALTVWLMRRFGDNRVVGGGSGRNRQQRLAVLDSAVVDARRRLVLIRRDNVEHLILIGGPTDVVVEPNIVRAAPATSGTVTRPSTRSGGFEDEDASIIPDSAPAEAERAPSAPRSSEPPRTMPRPAPQRVDPQYADMAQRLEQALRKPASELDVPRAPAPPAPPRTPEPRILEPRQVVAPAPRAPAPRAPEPRVVEPIITPPPRPVQPVQTAQPAPTHGQTAADVFGSLEEEMASLLRPGAKKENK